jgi:hypothetical protein
MTARGLLTGSQGSASVRAIEIWLRADQENVDRKKLAELQREVQRLETELQRERGRADDLTPTEFVLSLPPRPGATGDDDNE